MKKENRVYMLDSTWGAQMNSFIITTDKGGLIVIDGGWRQEAEKLLGKLREISGEEIPHVDGWFLSHCHSDHMYAFVEIMEHHKEEIKVDKLYYNFPSVQFLMPQCKTDANDLQAFYNALPKFADIVNIVTQGDKYDICGAHFDILYTTDPDFTVNNTNNSSTVFRMVLGGKTFMFLGDLGVEAGRKLLKMYGDELKSDYCQMAHHGQQGVERTVYEKIKPEICLWCTPPWLWDNDNGKGFNTHVWKTVETRGWMEEIGTKKNITVKDGDVDFRVE